jgi:hypothetical protein
MRSEIQAEQTLYAHLPEPIDYYNPIAALSYLQQELLPLEREMNML